MGCRTFLDDADRGRRHADHATPPEMIVGVVGDDRPNGGGVGVDVDGL
jgi:hypothetical protein